jgi:hypothetical protein
VRASAESVVSVSAAVHRVQSDATDAPVAAATVDRQLAVVPVTLGQDMEVILDLASAAGRAIPDQVAAVGLRAQSDELAGRVVGRVTLDRA